MENTKTQDATVDFELLLMKAIEIATEAHKGQVDKGGHPYIEHPLAVMERVELVEEKIVAVLHDVLEDTQWTEEELRLEGFPDSIIDGVKSVTRLESETYEAFVQRAANDPIGIEVKIADIEENMDLSRIPNPTEKDIQRIEKRYKRALKLLIDSRQSN